VRAWLPQLALVVALFVTTDLAGAAQSGDSDWLSWEALEDVPDDLGVAGAFAGLQMSDDAEANVLLFAGGANFPLPDGVEDLWDERTTKVYHDAVHALVREGDAYRWIADVGQLPQPIGYGASASSPRGVLCVGGQDAERAYADAFELTWHPETRSSRVRELPDLPETSTGGSAVWFQNALWVWTGQTGPDASSASNHLWRLDPRTLIHGFRAYPEWQPQPDLPAHGRTMAQLVVQHDGYDSALYLIGGRYVDADDPASQAAPLGLVFLDEVWSFHPGEGVWRQRASAPTPMTAGTALPFGQSHVFVLGHATGEILADACEAGGGSPDWSTYDHPGFPRKAWAYHTITDSWIEAGELPANQVTTPAVRWGDDLLVISGEVQPKVRTRSAWSFHVKDRARTFAALDYLVIIVYLLGMVGVGLWFMRKSRSTEAFFRGGKSIPWWAAGCSIYATMLSSLTFTGLPSKTFAQDWAYIGGTVMIIAVAPIAVFVALPFFRKLDATSAYEYLELRFNRSVRLFGSACFTVFHLFRMGIVMSLTALALSVCLPLDPFQSVLLMGGLSIAYCAMGGIEAVIWTDTIQTVVLLAGALFALVFMLQGSGEGFVDVALDHDKLRVMNWNLDMSSSQVAIWVILLGGLFQNVSSYTADQAVVQRYMTTPDEKAAARSIWTNAVLVVPGALIFYSLGTGLFLFYRAHPEALDPTITTDQILPLYIGTQLPTGIAGLIIAGVFAAAQSTVSTSMNSVSTTVVTDFLRPYSACRDDRGYLRAARVATVVSGVLGTAIALFFIDPSFKSLFDEFLRVVGMFMGVLGGLFLLGVLTRRATGIGAWIGSVAGVGVMVCLWKFTGVHAAIYPFFGVGSCFSIGWFASIVLPSSSRSIEGLTLYSMAAEVTTREGEADAC
jgi:solute:Na+ symporter, SSS family